MTKKTFQKTSVEVCLKNEVFDSLKTASDQFILTGVGALTYTGTVVHYSEMKLLLVYLFNGWVITLQLMREEFNMK